MAHTHAMLLFSGGLSLLSEPVVISTVALKVSPQGQVSGRSPQSSGSFRQSSGSCLRIFGPVVVSPQGQVSVIE